MASRIRRKPLDTYKSPSSEDTAYIPSPSMVQSREDSIPTSTHVTQSSNLSERGRQTHSTSRRRYSIKPPLPLYHPFGRLALSLPPLDPTPYGLPILAVPDEVEPRSSMRTRRPVTKAREVEDEPPTNSASASTVAAVAAQEVKDRPSPRKRRGGGAKRKRKDPDDGDATYPAKRTRIPRGVGAQGNDDESAVDGAQPDEGESVAEAMVDLSDSTKRRSTRAKGGHKRRDSSTSETTSISGSTHVISANADPPDSTGPVDVNNVQKLGGNVVDSMTGSDDKEEGELSEEHPGTS